jgi:RNA polymerase sigma-70 factor (ECF subfamily)
MQAAIGPVKDFDQGARHARFERVYAAHYELILAYALRRTQSRDDAADVVAETLLTAWRRFDQAPDGPEVRLWLYGIAHRVLANHLRGRRRRERLGARLRDAEAGATAAGRPAAAMAEARTAIGSAFGRLKPGDRDLLTLVAVEGLSPTEVARVLGCSAVAVRVRLHRARARFARELNAEGVQV